MIKKWKCHLNKRCLFYGKNWLFTTFFKYILKSRNSNGSIFFFLKSIRKISHFRKLHQNMFKMLYLEFLIKITERSRRIFRNSFFYKILQFEINKQYISSDEIVCALDVPATFGCVGANFKNRHVRGGRGVESPSLLPSQ